MRESGRPLTGRRKTRTSASGAVASRSMMTPLGALGRAASRPAVSALVQLVRVMRGFTSRRVRGPLVQGPLQQNGKHSVWGCLLVPVANVNYQIMSRSAAVPLCPRAPQRQPQPPQPGPSSPPHQPPERWTHAQQAAPEADRWASGAGDPSHQQAQQHQDAGPNNRHADERDWWRRPDPAATVHNEPVRLLTTRKHICVQWHVCCICTPPPYAR